ncbi:MAG TPA: amino acid adenylation domain-containing protein, partial [Thermoanaerobaculia bacterium]
TPNPQIDFESSPFYVASRLAEWPANGTPRRAGVSAFGIGGTNAHLILEEAPTAAPSGPSREWQILSLSARSAEALERATDELADHLASHPDQSLADVAFTLHVGRVGFSHRRVLIASDPRAAAAALASRDPRRVWTSRQEPGEKPIAFLLSGVGDHYAGMARGIYRTERVFREELDRCAELLLPHLGIDIRETIFAEAVREKTGGIDLRAMLGRGGNGSPIPQSPLDPTHIAQPAVFALSWALARLWMSWGVRPQALAGYSLGEYTAACLAGVLSLEDAAVLVAQRARLITDLPAGAMLAVPLSEASAQAELGPDLTIAAVNGPGVSVISGPVEAVADLERRLSEAEIASRRLPTTHAFHSRMMEPIQATVSEIAGRIRLAPPKIPLLSNLTGTWMEAEAATDPRYWSRHLRGTVRFGEAIEALWSEPGRVLLEIGPGQGLATLALQHPANPGGMAVSSLPHAQDGQPDQIHLLGTLGKLWLAGVEIDWHGFYSDERRRRLPLPTYPFERKLFWIDPPPRNGRSAALPSPEVSKGSGEWKAAVSAQIAPPVPAGARARHQRPALPNPYVAPTTSAEARLATLWQILLGFEPIGIHDNFFELGGHSLLGTQLMARLRAQEGVELPLSVLFESPTIAELAVKVSELSGIARPPLQPRPAGLIELPLSFPQERLWFLDQLEPENPFYNIATSYRLFGPVDLLILEQAWNEIVRRHESLRTIFAAPAGRPVQIVSPHLDLQVPVIDLSALPEDLRGAEARRQSRRLGRQPFDLARGPLLRVALLHLADREHALTVVMHHIISDGWSFQVAFSELIPIYNALTAGSPPPLPELSIQFPDYAIWHRRWLEGGALLEQLSYWTGRLAGAPSVLRLPTDRPRPVVQTYRGATERLALPADLAPALSRVAMEAGASSFMALLAAFQTLLYRHSGQDDIVIGMPIANRTQQETEGLIGFFVNTLALRTNLSGDPTFRELLGHVRQATLGAYDHQDLPFDRLVDALQPERSLSHAPIFQVVFQLLNQPLRRPATSQAITLEPWPVEIGVSQFDITFSMFEAGNSLSGTLDYNVDLFDRPTVLRLLTHFRALLTGVSTDSGRRLSELPAMSEPERSQVLLEWNDSTAEYPAACLHHLFESQVEKTPDAVAVTSGDESLTYRELNARASQLAHHLRKLGVVPEAPVGVAMERSNELVVALMSVLKAGAAYVPLDPGYPKDRLAAVVEDAFHGLVPPVFLTQSRLRDRLSSLLAESGARVLPLDTGWRVISGESTGNPDRVTYPGGLAYVIFTSGSTGRPKGAMNTHRGVVNRLLWMQDAYRLDISDRVLQKTPFSFDVSVWEFFWPLLTGARLVMAIPGGHQDPAYLIRTIAEESITTLHFVPSMLQALLEEPGLEALTSLRRVIASGEALPPALVERFFAKLPAGVELHNLYGPTEAAIDVTAWPCVPGKPGTSIPIGRPVSNTRIHLLDRDLNPVPQGVPGELHIGGVQVGRGYFGRPDLTAERFVPDTLGEPGSRFYKTGDLARWRSDGTVEYLGRSDYQIKIRGLRIELGEIEAALMTHPGVRESVVLVREDAPGDRRLVAYVIPATQKELSPPELREHLQDRVMEYMVPAAFVILEALPLSPNGKVDRKALPAPEWNAEGAFVAPRNPTEEALAGIWAELLRVERVGVEDNFFALGGDSMKAVRLVSRINSRLAGDLRVQDIFKHQSITSLVQRLAIRPGKSLTEERAAGLAEIERLQRKVLTDKQQEAKLPTDYEDFFPLSGIEKGMVYYSLLMPDQPVYHDQYAYFLSIGDIEAFFQAFELLIGRHPILRSTFHLYDFEEPMKVVHPRVRVNREIEDLSALPTSEQGRTVERYRSHDLHDKFIFNGELLWRLKLFKLREGLYCTVWTWHHAILEGWSNLSLWVEMNDLYSRPDLCEIEALPALASSYKDYVAITLGRGQSPATEAFWRETLAGVARNKLPFNRSKARERFSFGMPSIDRPLGSALLATLRSRASELNTSLQAVCLAAHIYLLHITSGEEDVVTGLVSHDRPGIPDGDKIIGCFLNTVPIRLRIPPDENGRSLVARASRYLAAEKEHEIPLADIATIVGAARETVDNPIFDTLLNFMDFHVVEDMEQSIVFRPEASRSIQGGFNLERNEMTNTLFDLEVSATLGRFNARIKYSPRHFERIDIERAVGLYERVLEALARDVDAPLGTESLLSTEEREQLVSVYNNTVREYPRERPLHSFFEEQAVHHPERVAVVGAGRELTYGELDEQANRLARHLLGQGVEPGDNVGVCFERTPELLIALMAVLKAAAAYVPLEPDYPAARKGYIVRQSSVRKILADRFYELPEGCAAEIVLFEPEALESYSAEPLSLRPRPEDLAYTIYTSGSTGTPKGVMIEHHSAVNLISWVNREHQVGPETRVLAVSSVCFDLSVYDVFGALGAGATLVLARQEQVQDPAALLRLVLDQRVTFWNSVPSTLGLLVQYLEETEPGFRGEDLEIAFLSGDWIPLSLPERARRFFPNLRLVSLGGATEATVWSIFHPIGEIDPAWVSIPYGKPLDNNAFYVLDRSLELVPPGVVGDLYIGGLGVARGYAGDAQKTAASYVPDPFAGRPGARLYRTGDLGRMLPEGEIEFLGRSDHQVKIRGFRIELGEIESQLSRHPAVRETVVVARTDRTGQRYLCAYVVAAEAPSAEPMKAHLAESLPAYMIPDVFVALAELPLTANGKVDRKALPEPEVANLAGADGYVAPEGETETGLVEIWEEVLGTSGIGTRHDFFALGGHSLSAIQVLTRVRRRFEVDLPLPDFFEQPTIAGVAVTVERLRREGRTVYGQPLARRARPERLPLSFAQERLWFLDRLQPDSSFYSLPLAVELRGRFSWPVLAASLNEVVARHEVLRATFVMGEGEPVQIVAPSLDVSPLVADLSSLPEGRRKEEAYRLKIEQAVRPFDLSRGPLIRTTLLRLSEDRHVALFNMHHIVSDGWSMGILISELAALYRAFAAGEASPLPELPVQYADFALWQREHLSGEALESQVRWWREQLAGAPDVLDLPTDRPRPAIQSLRGAHEKLALPARIAEGVETFSRQQGVTSFMTLVSLFAALLRRYSHAEDILLGSPIAGRNQTETEKLIGLFVNTLVLRAQMADDPPFAELLERVRQMTLGAYTHQDLPFEKLVEEIQPERSLAHTPLFQVMLVLQNAPVGTLEIPGLTLAPVPVDSGTSRFDLHLSLTELPGGLFGDMEYSRDLFDPATIRRLLGHFRTLIEEVLTTPGARLSELSLLSGGERHQILLGWNDTAVWRQPGVCLHELFAEQAGRAPEAPAIIFEDRTLTYGELDHLSSRLAHHLRSLGVGPDCAVGVLMERSAEMVIALMGVLKAGAGYLPLDPEYPSERLGWIAENARVPVLLAQERLLATIPPVDAHVLFLETGWDGSGIEGVNAAPEVWDESLAYVLYTSGSTGRPKGVMVPHRGIVNRLLWMQETYELTPGDRVLQKTPYSFDVSVWELFWPLITGACLVVARPGGHRDGDYLTEVIEGESVTVMHFVPSMLQAFLEQPDLTGCSNLRLVVCSGEALSPELRRRFRERLAARLENLYGPTEASVDVTSWDCAQEGRGGAVPIGRPVANTRIHLLDHAFRPVPIGVAGELCIGGVQLARGYWNRSDLTAERFVPDPVGETPGERLYRTGDLARHLPDGAVEFLGRIDYQVKVRGFRIELGEIESVLLSHPGVREAIVLAREQGGGERQLVGYVVPKEREEIAAAELRAYLAVRLPDYMVPAAWVLLEKLPLTNSGKVDRKALPAPEAPSVGYVAPRSPVEQIVAGLWAELLRVPRVGIEDNFFDLGGDSIRAVRLVSRVNERLSADLKVQDVFKYQTVGALAERLAIRSGSSLAEERTYGLAQIEAVQQSVLADERQRAKLPADYEDFFPLSGIEKGMIYYSLLLPDQPIYHDQHAYLMSIPDIDRFYRALGLLVGRHSILRSTFHLYDFEEPMKVVHRTISFAKDVEDLSGLDAGEQRRRIEQYRIGDLREKFVFNGERLWRLKLFRLQGDVHGTVWTWHHAILDGWSNLTFWVELNELCARPDLEAIEALAPLESSYKDYLAISLGRSHSAVTESFWRETLAGSNRNKLPFNRAKTREKSAYGMRSLQRRLDRELLLELRARAAELHVSLQSVFLAAHLHLLHLTSGEEDVVTGVVSHDRPGVKDGDKIVGCFLNTFPIRMGLRAGESGRSLLRRVGQYLIQEKEHEIPLVDIAAIIGARDTADNPVFDTILNFMDFHLMEDVEDNVLFRPMTGRPTSGSLELQSEEMTNTLFDVEISATLSAPFVRIKYSPRHFEATDVERAVMLYQRILESLARDLDTPLGAEGLLSAEEREQLVSVYNDTVRDYPRERPLHSFFEEQAVHHPERVAVVGAGRELTYGELDEQANRLAGHLLGQGVEPGDNVGVCFERTPELLIVLMAVLKAAAAYVPLEPDYPAARKGYIVRQSSVRKILADRFYELPEGCEAEIVLFEPEALESYSAEPLSLRPRPEDLAYTIYTSGSTGTPKGVMIEHHSAVNLINWVNREYRVGPETRVLAVSSVCFDLSVYDVFGALGAGATLVLVRQEQVQDPAALLRLVIDQRVTFWNSVPSTLGLLVQYLEETEPGFRGEDLEIAFLSGDWIPLS